MFFKRFSNGSGAVKSKICKCLSNNSSVSPMFSNRCLEPSSPSVGKKSSFLSPAATASLLTQEGLQQFGKRQEGAWEAKRQKREVSVEEQEEGSGCWMPDTSQFVEKRIKVEGVGMKMVQDLTMDDFLRLVRVSLT